MRNLNRFWMLGLVVSGLLFSVAPAYADQKLQSLDKEAKRLIGNLVSDKQHFQQLVADSGCVTNAIQFDDIPGRKDQSVAKRSANCPAGSAEAVKLERQIQETTKQILVNRLEANQRRFELKSGEKSEKQAYHELSLNIKKILEHEGMATLSQKTRNEVRAIANQFLEKSKQAKTEAGISTCTNCTDKGPIQDLSKFIEQMKK